MAVIEPSTETKNRSDHEKPIENGVREGAALAGGVVSALPEGSFAALPSSDKQHEPNLLDFGGTTTTAVINGDSTPIEAAPVETNDSNGVIQPCVSEEDGATISEEIGVSPSLAQENICGSGEASPESANEEETEDVPVEPVTQEQDPLSSVESTNDEQMEGAPDSKHEEAPEEAATQDDTFGVFVSTNDQQVKESQESVNKDETVDVLEEIVTQDDPFGAFESLDNRPVEESTESANEEEIDDVPQEAVTQEDPFGAFESVDEQPELETTNAFTTIATEENGIDYKAKESADEPFGFSNGVHTPMVDSASAAELSRDLEQEPPLQQTIEASEDTPVEEVDFRQVADNPTETVQGAGIPAQTSNDSDDFGDFNDVAETTQVVVAPVLFTSSRAGDDDAADLLGGCNEHASAQSNEIKRGVVEETTQELELAQEITVLDDDDFGDFTATPQSVIANTQEFSAPEPTVVAPEPATVDNDDFAESTETQESVEEETIQQTELAQQPAAQDDDTDDFGNFNTTAQNTIESFQDFSVTAAVALDAAAVNNVKDVVESNEIDQPSAAEETSQEPDLAQEPAVQEDDAEDFGNFAAVPRNVVGTTPDLAASEPTDSAPEIAVVENDFFGDFAESAQIEQPVMEEMAQESQDTDANYFGDLTAAHRNDEPMQKVSAPEQTDASPTPALAGDDDCVGFSDAAESTEPTQSEMDQVTNITLDQVAQDDDFGAFGDAPQSVGATSQAEPAPADDDFGDFGDFNGAPQSIKPAPAVQGDDNDFGDFGDFDDAPQSTEPTAPSGQVDDDFGDFSDAPESTRKAPQPLLPLNDPFVNRAKAVFAEMFGNGKEEDANEEIEANGAEKETAALADILAEILSEVKEPASPAADRTDEKLGSMLGSIKMCEQSSPSVILNRKAVQPYSHYSSPAVVPSVELDIGERKLKRWSASEFEVAEADDVELSAKENAETPEEQTDEESNGKDAVDIPPTDIKLDFTDFKAPLENDDSGTAAKTQKQLPSAAQLFLQQIPDLAFMLSSTLAPPKE